MEAIVISGTFVRNGLKKPIKIHEDFHVISITTNAKKSLANHQLLYFYVTVFVVSLHITDLLNPFMTEAVII